MNIFQVSYDLNAPGKNYDKLLEAIRSYRDVRHPLKSMWFVYSASNAQAIARHLSGFIDTNDHLFVSEITLEGHFGLLSTSDLDWLHGKLAGHGQRATVAR